MKLRSFVPVALTIALALPNGGILTAQRQPIAQLIRAEGKVELKQSGKPTYRPAKANEFLFHGDLLRVPKGSRGVIRCSSDLTSWTIPADGLPRGVANTCSPSASS